MAAYDLLPKLVRAALTGDKKSVETIALMLGRTLKKEYPAISSEIMQITANNSVGADVLRSIDLNPAPVDKETRSQLVKIEESIEVEPPILAKDVEQQLQNFVKERRMMDRFLEEEVVPPNSILLYGKPGVGKTYVAKWLSYELNLPIVTVDLANSISSYLGRTGQNIKSIFNYVKGQSVILFLDEIDAIAKRRDDAADLGELKRLVNVLLKELEDCPVSCVIIGATNHPELLDKAIWRRFDRNIEVPLPDEIQRRYLFERTLGKWNEKFNVKTIEFIVKNSKGVSAADICKLGEHIKRQILINEDDSCDLIAMKECSRTIRIDNKEEKISFCKRLRNDFPKLTIRDISEITHIPATTVNRYVKE